MKCITNQNHNEIMFKFIFRYSKSHLGLVAAFNTIYCISINKGKSLSNMLCNIVIPIFYVPFMKFFPHMFYVSTVNIICTMANNNSVYLAKRCNQYNMSNNRVQLIVLSDNISKNFSNILSKTLGHISSCLVNSQVICSIPHQNTLDSQVFWSRSLSAYYLFFPDISSKKSGNIFCFLIDPKVPCIIPNLNIPNLRVFLSYLPFAHYPSPYKNPTFFL